MWRRRQRWGQYDEWHFPPCSPSSHQSRKPLPLIFCLYAASRLFGCLCFFVPIFLQSDHCFVSLCGEALPVSSWPAWPIEPVKKRGELLHGPPGVASDGEAILIIGYSVKRAGSVGGWLYLLGLLLYKSSCLSSTSLALIFMILGMHSEAAGTPVVWRGALLIPPFSFFLHSVFLPKSFFLLLFFIQDRSKGWVSSENTSGWAVFILAKAWSFLYVWKDCAGWNLPSTPHIALDS